MKHVALWQVILVSLAGTGLALSQGTTSARFSGTLPEELQCGCVLHLDAREEALAETLANGNPDGQLIAALALWQGHSRRHSTMILTFPAGWWPGGEAFRSFQRQVDAALQPQAILRELREGDYLWGAWLAFLRPHEELVPVLLKMLKEKPENVHETILALGNSGDPRALQPLLNQLKSKDYWIPGAAAQALGYLANPEAEPKLIEALAADNPFLKVEACGALAKLGSRRALPPLERLAKDNSFTGVLNIRGMAEIAVERIRKREKR